MDKPADTRYQLPSGAPSLRFVATWFVASTLKTTSKPLISYQSVTPRAPLSSWDVTQYEFQQACALAERVSRGEEAGTSGSFRSNPVVELEKARNNFLVSKSTTCRRQTGSIH
jgi:hypothetical protein